MKQEELFERILRVSTNPRSVFLSYAWDDVAHRTWVAGVAGMLRSEGYDVVLDRDERMEAAELIPLGMSCKNVLCIVTPKFMEVCLMGLVQPTQDYSILPSFSRIHEATSDRSAGIEMLSDAIGNYARRQSGAQPLSAKELHADAAKKNLYSFYWEGWCLDEHQLLAHNEAKYERIGILYRSGPNCFCRYPIIDCSDEKDAGALESLLEYLRSPPRAGHKALARPMIWRAAKGKSGEVASALLPPEHFKRSLPGVTFWRASGRHRLVVRPSVTDDGSVATTVQLFHDWESLR